MEKEKTYILYHDFNPIITNKEKYYPYECAFETKKLQIISEHVPVSVSIFSNVPDYDNEPIFLCNKKPAQLVDDFIKTIVEISLKAESINKIKYADIIKKIDEYTLNVEHDYNKF